MYWTHEKNGRNKMVLYVNLSVQMQEFWDGDMALTVAKSLPAGLHLYSTLTGVTFSKVF